jgi:hypothetical protein
MCRTCVQRRCDQLFQCFAHDIASIENNRSMSIVQNRQIPFSACDDAQLQALQDSVFGSFVDFNSSDSGRCFCSSSNTCSVMPGVSAVEVTTFLTLVRRQTSVLKRCKHRIRSITSRDRFTGYCTAGRRACRPESGTAGRVAATRQAICVPRANIPFCDPDVDSEPWYTPTSFTSVPAEEIGVLSCSQRLVRADLCELIRTC